MRLSLVLRAAAAVCLALLPLGVFARSPWRAPRYALVLDDSPSVERRFPGFAGETLALWEEFRGGGEAVIAAGEHPRPPGEGSADRRTDLGPALRAAADLGEPGVETRILLATDGLTAAEGLEATIRHLRERGARVFALAPPEAEPVARVVDLAAPERAFLSEPYPVRARVQAARPGRQRVVLERNGAPAGEAAVVVDAEGAATAEFLQESDRVGRVRYRARLAGGEGPGAAAEVNVAEAPRVRWIAEDFGAAGPLVGLLRGAGVDVELTHPADLLFPDRDLAGDEVVVLDDLPSPALTESLGDALREAVGKRGAGLVVIGGRKGLGSGEYERSPLGPLLPVRPGFQGPPPPESVALVIALDTSLSMFFRGRGDPSFGGAGVRKIDVARESVQEVVRILRPGDRLGVLGNSTDIFWVHRLGEVTDRPALLERVGRIAPIGGGIFFYSVLHEAYEALRADPAGLRHVLVLCDAEDIDQYEIAGRGHSFDLIRAMAQEGVTLSILAIGRPGDKDVPFLRSAAQLGRGDFYLVPRIVALPRYFTSEYRRLASERFFLEEEVRPVASERGLLPGGAAPALPPLAGMALVTAREGARTLLQTNLGAPLLVEGDYGRGRTAVFAGDDGFRWSGRWLAGPGARRFWLRLLLAAAPAEDRARGFASSLAADRERGRLLFHYAPADGSLPGWDRLWALPAPGEPGVATPLERVGLRTFRGALAPGGEGYRRVEIAAGADGAGPLLTAGYRLGPFPEDLPAAPRWGTVERLVVETGGDWVGEPAQIAAPPGRAGRIGRGMPVAAAAAAVLLLLGEVLVRTWREE